VKLEEWQKFRLGETFGWKRKDGSRRFKTSYNEYGRKNGKSFEGAGVALYCEGGDGEPGAQVYCAATKEEQAREAVHDAAKAMIAQSPELRKYYKVLAKAIVVHRAGASFKPLGANSKTQDGLNCHCAIIDETHAHTDRRVWMKLKTSMVSRRQPLTWIITTAGVYDPGSIGWELHQDAVNVLEGVYEDDSLFAYIAAPDDKDDWTKPKTWWKANPNLGVSVKLEAIAELCEEAKRKPSFENEFKQMHLNLWVEQVTRWLSMEAWRKCAGRGDLSGRPCFGGLDLSTKLDMTAFCLWFPPARDGRADDRHDLLWRFWIPEERVREMAKTGREPYLMWAETGALTMTPGDSIDNEFIRRDINRLAERYQIAEIAFDPWNAWELSLKLSDEDGLVMVETRQGFRSMSEPAKEFERLVVSRMLRHGDDPVARWMASNVAVRQDSNGNIMPDKAKSTKKIDGIVAAIMAGGRMLVHQDEGLSVYEERGLTVL
jgi:phage terminase large subunit-like protein